MKIKVAYFKGITMKDIKRVKAFAKEQKPELESIVRETVRAIEEVLNIRFLGEIKEAKATYYNDWARPVISVSGLATDRNVSPLNPGYWLFVEAYKTLDENGCAANIYRREA